MREIVSIKLNDEPIHIFDYIWYIHDGSEHDYELMLEVVVSEIQTLKYEDETEQEMRVTLDYNNGQSQDFIMILTSVTDVEDSEIPTMYLSTSINDINEFPELRIVDWNTPVEIYPRLSKNITLEEIRSIEMPDREIDITAKLPIDLVEWVYKNEENISEILKEALYKYSKEKASK